MSNNSLASLKFVFFILMCLQCYRSGRKMNIKGVREKRFSRKPGTTHPLQVAFFGTFPLHRPRHVVLSQFFPVFANFPVYFSFFSTLREEALLASAFSEVEGVRFYSECSVVCVPSLAGSSNPKCSLLALPPIS